MKNGGFLLSEFCSASAAELSIFRVGCAAVSAVLDTRRVHIGLLRRVRLLGRIRRLLVNVSDSPGLRSEKPDDEHHEPDETAEQAEQREYEREEENKPNKHQEESADD
jgi:hypothetical protein